MGNNFLSVGILFQFSGCNFFLIHDQNLFFGIQRFCSLIDEARRSSFFYLV